MANGKKCFHHLPKRIILVRHGESQVNVDEQVLEYVPNYKIKLSENGIRQAQEIGLQLKNIISNDNEKCCKQAFFYFSPSNRTRETMEEIAKAFGKDEAVMGVREECRLREQHFGNFQDVVERKKIKAMRDTYGKFFFRVPNGESSADVYDRVSTFIEGLWREMESEKLPSEGSLIIVSHGLTILIFLMKWFNWTVDQFQDLTNPRNCEYRVLELCGPSNSSEYSLAVHHSLEELREWGLSQEMIEDQKLRACGHNK